MRGKGKGQHTHSGHINLLWKGPPRLFSTVWFTSEEGGIILMDTGDKTERRIQEGPAATQCFVPEPLLCSQRTRAGGSELPMPLQIGFHCLFSIIQGQLLRGNKPVAATVEIPSAISLPSLTNLFSAPVVFLINTSEIFMKATSMK